MENFLGKNLKIAHNEEYDIEKFSSIKLILVYFSASFCSPSVKFTELLMEYYK